MTDEQRKRFHKFIGELDEVDKVNKLSSFDNMVQWLLDDHYYFYLQVKDYLRELWEEVKSTIGDVAEGAVKGIAAVTLTPLVGVIKGVEEGFKKGSIAEGIEGGLKAMGTFIDDLFS